MEVRYRIQKPVNEMMHSEYLKEKKLARAEGRMTGYELLVQAWRKNRLGYLAKLKSKTTKELQQYASTLAKKPEPERRKLPKRARNFFIKKHDRIMKVISRINIYKDIRPGILAQRGYSCEKCHQYSRNPHLHHIDKNRLNNANDNLLVLCPDCHADQHPNNAKGMRSFWSRQQYHIVQRYF